VPVPTPGAAEVLIAVAATSVNPVKPQLLTPSIHTIFTRWCTCTYSHHRSTGRSSRVDR
jgi:NADPH:quinone reductase-like Zn-dependent oxidoreductase